MEAGNNVRDLQVERQMRRPEATAMAPAQGGPAYL